MSFPSSNVYPGPDVYPSDGSSTNADVVVLGLNGVGPTTPYKSNPQQYQSDIPGIRYGYQTVPWDAPLSWGVQALIEYNGYIINDRYQSDRIRITSITGMDEPDLSDSREVIPGDDGEVVYDSYYRGRTIVMTGRIESGSLGNLKRFERDLRAAYASKVELPLKFRWFDVYDGFNDPDALSSYIQVAGSPNSATISSGALLIQGEPVAFLRSADNRLWGDKRVTVRTLGGAVSGSSVSIIASYKDVNNFVYVDYASGLLSINVTSVGVNYVLASIATDGALTSQSIWLRATTNGDEVGAELWLTPPSDNQIPTFSTSATLQGFDSDQLGDQVLTLVGVAATPGSGLVVLDDLQIESWSPGDVTFNARRMPGGLSIKDSQDATSRFNRAVQITMRASSPYALSATQSRSGIFVPAPIAPASLGFTFPMTFPLSFRQYITSQNATANTFITVTNRGTAPTRPIIFIYGPIEDFELANLVNDQTINWTGSLVDGDYLVFDCARRTLVNSAGANQMAYFTSSSSVWLQLESGPNDIYLAGSDYSGNTKMVVYWKHGWI